MILYFRSPHSLCFLTWTRILIFGVFLSITMNVRTIEASPYGKSLTTASSSTAPNSISNMSNLDSMRAYLIPKCDKVSTTVTFSQKNTISLQDCHVALSQLSYNISSYLNLTSSVTTSINTCSLTVSKVIENDSDFMQRNSPIEIYAPSLYGPLGQILTSCLTKTGSIYLWAGEGTNLQMKVNAMVASN